MLGAEGLFMQFQSADKMRTRRRIVAAIVIRQRELLASLCQQLRIGLWKRFFQAQ